jgi:hypothetical protein
MPVPQSYAVDHYRGDALSILVRLWADTAHTQPVDPTGADVLAQVKAKATDDEPLQTFSVIATAPNFIQLSLLPDQVTSLPNSTVWDCQVNWDHDPTAAQTVVRGTLKLTQDVSRA